MISYGGLKDRSSEKLKGKYMPKYFRRSKKKEGEITGSSLPISNLLSLFPIRGYNNLPTLMCVQVFSDPWRF